MVELKSKKYIIDINDTLKFDFMNFNNGMETSKYDMIIDPYNYMNWESHGLITATIKTSQNEQKLAFIGSNYCDSENCAILSGDNLLMLMTEELYVFSLSRMSLIKSISLEDNMSTFFEIHSFMDGYILYGEVEIIMLNKNLEQIWSFSAKDILVRPDAKPSFKITKNLIYVEDWLGYKYILNDKGELSVIKLAEEIARKAHKDQYDKGGIPYISHPLYVSSQVNGEEEKIVALLHDVCEDSDVSLQDLASYGFEQKIIDAVDAITKREGEDYNTYISRLKSNPIAKEVKKADLKHNSDLSRIPNPSEKDYKRIEKYKKILFELSD